MKTIGTKILNETLSWNQYLKLTEDIVNHEDRPEKYRDEKMLRYTTQNLERMKRISAHMTVDTKLYNALSRFTEPMTWMVLTEPWCGDASQSVPALQVLAACNENIRFCVLLSDSHQEVLAQFLTNGSYSIPKLVCLNAQNEVIAVWGPRPKALQDIAMVKLKDPSLSFGQKVKLIHEWYDQDATKSLQEEFTAMVKSWELN
ncbi:MAG: thioredoxin family protein [Chitinophagales bacterium]